MLFRVNRNTVPSSFGDQEGAECVEKYGFYGVLYQKSKHITVIAAAKTLLFNKFL